MKLDRFRPVVKYLGEPHIEVGEGVAVPEPKMGWTLVGPLGKQNVSYEIRLGLVGDPESLEKARNLIQKLYVTAYGKDKSFLHIAYPGLEKVRLKLDVKEAPPIDSEVVSKQFENTASLSDRIEIATRVISDRIKSFMDRHPQPDVLVLAYPKIIEQYCVQAAVGNRRVAKKTALERAIERLGKSQMTLETFFGEPVTPVKVFRPLDLRSMVKAICMEHKIPIQILRAHTLNPYNPDKPTREDDATTFWNLVVATFYKANHLPWRVQGLMEDTCYLGISFFRDREDSSNVKTALAQVFSLDAEGFVFKGEQAVIDENNAAHISNANATSLVKYAIEVYIRSKKHPPQRIVIHKTSRYDSNEIRGFRAGAGTSTLDLVAFGTRDIKLLRWGQHPPIRGTMVRLPDQSVLLYTFGYIPYLGVYPGPRVPSPLEILEHHGTTSIESICLEILALTKLNWNNAKFCTKSPITIGFARRVGEIIRQVPQDTDLAELFKFYM
jgi:hypothetical protein